MDWKLFAGLLALVVGAIICFGGYRFFRFLMVVVGFGTGFVLGALGVALFTKTQFLSEIWGWVAAIGAGLVLAVLAWPFYAAGIAILGAAAGYLIGSGVMVYLSFGTGYLTQGVAVGAGLVLVILLFVLRVHRAVVMIYTALAGGAIILGGALFLAGQLPYAPKTGYDPTPLLRDQPIWLLLWAGASLVGLGTQWASRPRVPKATTPAQPAPAATPPAESTTPTPEPAASSMPAAEPRPAGTPTPAPEPAPSPQPAPPPQQEPPPPPPGGGSQVAPSPPHGTPAPTPPHGTPAPPPPHAQPGPPPPAHTPPPPPPGQPGVKPPEG